MASERQINVGGVLIGAGAPVSVRDPAGDYDATAYTYVPSGKLATITDAAGNTWSYTYDLLGRRIFVGVTARF